MRALKSSRHIPACKGRGLGIKPQKRIYRGPSGQRAYQGRDERGI